MKTITEKWSAFRASIEPEIAKARPLDAEIYHHKKAARIVKYRRVKVDPKRRMKK